MSSRLRARSWVSAPRGPTSDNPRGKPSRVASGRLTWGRPPRPATQRQAHGLISERLFLFADLGVSRGCDSGRAGQAQDVPFAQHLSDPGLHGTPLGLVFGDGRGIDRCRPIEPLADSGTELRPDLADPRAVVGPYFRRLQVAEDLHPRREAVRTHLNAIASAHGLLRRADGALKGIGDTRVHHGERVFRKQKGDVATADPRGRPTRSGPHARTRPRPARTSRRRRSWRRMG